MSGNVAPGPPASDSPLDVRRLAGPATFTLGAQAVRVVATMLLTVWVSRLLGPEALGLLTLGLTLATTATIIACVGVDQGVIYFVARTQPSHLATTTADALIRPGTPLGSQASPVSTSSSPAAVRTALTITAVGGLIIGALAWLLAPTAADTVFDAPELRRVLLILAPSIPIAALFSAALGAMQGSFRVAQRAIIEWIVFPLSTLALAIGLLLSGGGIEGVATGYLIAWAVSSAVAVAIVLRIEGDRRPLIFRQMLVFSLPLMLSLLTGYLLFHIDVLMLGGLSSVREVGLYGVATRLALPLFLVLDSVGRAFTPLAAHLYSKGEVKRLGAVYGAATEWIMAINVPAGLFIALNAEPILGLFGTEFVAATGALRVLCLGIVLATACGAASPVLTMTRWQRLEMIDNLLLLLLNIMLNLALVPRFGALGAALATASSASSVYALKVLQVGWLLSVQPFRRRQAATIALALSAAAASWLSTLPLDLAPNVELAVRMGVFSALYGVLWWHWGCSATSREVLRSIGRRPR